MKAILIGAIAVLVGLFFWILYAVSVYAQVASVTVGAVTDTTAALTWTVSGPVDHFTIPRKDLTTNTFCCAITVLGTGTTATHSGLTPSTSYEFHVQARNSAGALINAMMVQATTAASGPAPAPTPVQPSATLTWTDNSGNTCTATLCDQEQGFEVERMIGTSGTFAKIGAVAANITQFIDDLFGIAAGTTVQYRVRAYNTVGFSAYSGSAAYIVPGSTPTLQIVAPVAPGVVSVSFACNSPYVYNAGTNTCQ